MTKPQSSQQQGSFLVAALVMILFLTAIGLSLSALVAAQYRHTARATYVANAQLVAEAGIEQSVRQINVDEAFTGFSTPQVFFDNSTQGKGTFTTTITDNPDGSKNIVSTGKVYRSSAAPDPLITRKVKVLIVGTTSDGYSVFSGPGGLILSGNANIVNSNVYVGGTLTLNGNSSIGTYSNPLVVNVANKACPTGSDPGPTYPEVCSGGSQPIDFSANSMIYGTVCATGQTGDPNNNIDPGDGGEGLKLGCTAPPTTQPTYDRQAQIDAVSSTFGAASYPHKCATWPANLQIVGNLSMDGNCKAIITGDAYITGNLEIGGNVEIRVSDTLGSDRPVVMVDGTITINGNPSLIANASGTGIHFISFKNSTGDPNATITGTALKESQSIQSITLEGNGDMPGMIFNAYWSKVYLGGNGQMGAVTGQMVELAGNGTVIFGAELASGSKTWAISSYQRLYD